MADNRGSPIEWQVPDGGTGAPEDSNEVRAFVVRPGKLVDDLNRFLRIMLRCNSSYFPCLHVGKVNGFQFSINSSGDVIATDTDGSTYNLTDTGGDVTGPASSTDFAVALYNGVTGKQLRNSLITSPSNEGGITWPGETVNTPSSVDLSENAQEDDSIRFNSITVAHVTAVSGGQTVVTGIAGGTEGRYLRIRNLSGGEVVLDHDDSSGGSLDANHILLTAGADLTVVDGEVVELEYASSRWRQI